MSTGVKIRAFQSFAKRSRAGTLASDERNRGNQDKGVTERTGRRPLRVPRRILSGSASSGPPKLNPSHLTPAVRTIVLNCRS